jgi:hypothetical protein
MNPMKLPRILKPFYCRELVRLGKDYDGGYLVNYSDVIATTRLLSLGIGPDNSYEVDFFRLNPCQIDAYDEQAKVDESFFIDGKRLHKQNVTGSIESILKGSNVFLKCDIEGDEYGLLDSLIANTQRFTGMVIEFHDVNQPDKFDQIANFIGKVDQKLVHVHANNNSYIETPEQFIPSCLELTFSSAQNVFYRDVELPHPLDMPNEKSRLEFKLVFP